MTIRSEASVIVVEIGGPLDAVSTNVIRTSLRERLSQESKDVILDFSGCPFIDPAGIGFVIALCKQRLNDGRNLRMYGAHGQPKQLMAFLRLDRAVPAVDRLPNGDPAALN